MDIKCGDCLEMMRGMDAESIDLIATDPPYNTGRNFGAYDDRRGAGYIDWLAERLAEMRRLLKPTGSIYLQCDPHESHYIKCKMDEIFGRANFRNEIVWSYRTGGTSKRKFAAKHDNIYFYSKNSNYYFESMNERSYCAGSPPGFQGIKKFQDETGRWFTLVNMRDTWAIDAIGRSSTERLGYPTQKPVALYERIVKASSPECGVVFDPFCGSGTTLVAARNLGRRYIGIDSNPEAIDLVRSRLRSDTIAD